MGELPGIAPAWHTRRIPPSFFECSSGHVLHGPGEIELQSNIEMRRAAKCEVRHAAPESGMMDQLNCQRLALCDLRGGPGSQALSVGSC